MKTKFLTNLFNPNLPDAKRYIHSLPNETQEEAWQHQQQWLQGKIIGRPQATTTYTVEELENMDMVGVYVEVREIRND